MRKSFSIAVRCLAVVAVMAVLVLVAGTSAPAGSPYASALSSLAASPAQAATHCENRACSTDPKTLKYICVTSAGTSCAAYNSRYPVASKCIETAC